MTRATTPTPYTLAFQHATPHGVLAAMHIPDSPDPVADEVLESLVPEETTFARTLRGYRQVEFSGGRLALRAACSQLGLTGRHPFLPNDRGAPILPKGYVGSISHKRDLALAMVARAGGGTLGIDLEDYGPPRPRIADRILTPGELEAIADLPPGKRWMMILLRFSIKESIYKALDPYVRRYVGFHEAIVTPHLQGVASVELNLAENEGPFEVDARYEWLRGRVLTSTRIRRASTDP